MHGRVTDAEMREHGPLGPPSGAGGIEDDGRVLLVDLDRSWHRSGDGPVIEPTQTAAQRLLRKRDEVPQLRRRRALALEAKRNGIRANVRTPSLTGGTDHYRRVMDDAFAGKMFAKAAAMASLGVVGKEELAGLVVFVASPAAAQITGQAISMTGGISAL